MRVAYGLAVIVGAGVLGLGVGCSSADPPNPPVDDTATQTSADGHGPMGFRDQDRDHDRDFDRDHGHDRFSYEHCRDLHRGDADFDECVRRYRNLVPIP